MDDTSFAHSCGDPVLGATTGRGIGGTANAMGTAAIMKARGAGAVEGDGVRSQEEGVNGHAPSMPVTPLSP
jgi:hypothetical protein